MSRREPDGEAPRSTFRARLTIRMTLLSLGVLGATSLAIYVGIRETLLSNLDDVLLTIARTEVASAVDEPGDKIHLHEVGPASLALPTGSGYEKIAQIKDEHHEVSVETANLHGGPPLETDPDKEDLAISGQASFGNLRRGTAAFRGIYYPLPHANGLRHFAVVAISTKPVRRTLDLLFAALATALVLGGAAASLGANRLAQRLTQPLERIAEAARSVGEPNLSARITDVSPDVEFRQVVGILNNMLARLEAAFVSERRFVADASHELRSPLANLRGTIEVALRRPRTPEEYREMLATSLVEVERLSRLVNDLLTLSRVDAGQLALDLARCDLASLTRNAIRAHAASADERGVRFRLDAPEALPVLGDADRLRQVIDNLLDNSLRYAPAGSTVVTRARHSGGEVSLDVVDQGPGLSPEDQAHVFDRFYRADSSRARHSGGLGLGLSISRAIVEAHHGRLTVQSQPGAGSTFSMILPVAAEATLSSTEKRRA